MKALVINLDSSFERMAFQKNQLTRLKIPYERMSAICSDELDDLVYEKDAYSWQRPLRKVEVACFLSHMKCWQKIVDSRESALILEDDALLSSSVACILDKLEDISFDYMTLETRARKKYIGKERHPLIDGHAMAPMIQDKCGAAGYVMTPSGAKKALDHYERVGAAITDAFLAHLYDWRSYQLVPAAIIQIDCAEYYGVEVDHVTKSSIATREKPRIKGNVSFIRYKWRRMFGQVITGLCIISNFGAEKLDVGIRSEEFMTYGD